MRDLAQIIEAAERVLCRETGQTIRLGEPEILSEPERRNAIVRCRNLSGSQPACLIIKQVVAETWDPDDGESWDVQRFFKEWSGVRLLGELEVTPAVSPRYYGGDRSLGFFILEDLGPHRSLVEPLLEGTAADAEAALCRYTSALGRLHAATAGMAERYEAINAEINPGVAAEKPTEAAPASDTDEAIALLRLVNLEVNADTLADILTMREEINNPGPFLAFIHGDPCPDNVFFSHDHITIIDFEFARMSHALIDGVYGRIMFPTCWCCNRLPESVVSAMESAYRSELARAVPQAEDDRVFYGGIVAACAHWALGSLSWHLERALKEDGEWGIAGVRQRILARLEAFIVTSERYGRFPALRATMAGLLTALQLLWPDAQPLPLYPAFRPID